MKNFNRGSFVLGILFALVLVFFIALVYKCKEIATNPVAQEQVAEKSAARKQTISKLKNAEIENFIIFKSGGFVCVTGKFSKTIEYKSRPWDLPREATIEDPKEYFNDCRIVKRGDSEFCELVDQYVFGKKPK